MTSPPLKYKDAIVEKKKEDFQKYLSMNSDFKKIDYDEVITRIWARTKVGIRNFLIVVNK